MTRANGRGRKYRGFKKPGSCKSEARAFAQAAVASHPITKVPPGLRAKYRPMSTAPLDGRFVRLYPADGGAPFDGYFSDGLWWREDDEVTPVIDPCGWSLTNRARQHRRPADVLTEDELAGKWAKTEAKAGRDLRDAARLNGHIIIDAEELGDPEDDAERDAENEATRQQRADDAEREWGPKV